MSAAAFAAGLHRHRLVAILRRVDPSTIEARVAALVEGGVRMIEVAFSDAGAGQALDELVRIAPKDVLIGAGTVTTLDVAERAAAAGARFLVTPHVVPEVAAFANAHDLGSLIGAMTPTEIAGALAAGAQYVKLFPASALGPGYGAALRGPYPNLPWVAVGGIDANNLGAYLAAGAIGVGIGGGLAADGEGDGFAGVREEARRCQRAIAAHESIR